MLTDVIDGDQLVFHSDALLAAFGPDGECDGEAFDAAAAASFDAKSGSVVLLCWTHVLAATGERGDTPLAPPLDQLAGEVDDAVRDVVRRHGRALINTARLGDDAALTERWLRILDTVDDHGLGWMCWAMAAATAPVMRTLGGTEHFLAAVDVVQEAVRLRADVPVADLRSIAASLCAVAAGENDAAQRYLSLLDVHRALTILIALIPALLPGKTTMFTLDPAGIPSGAADPDDVDVQRLNALLAAATAADPARAVDAIRTAAPVDDPGDLLRLLWYLTLSLGSRLGTIFVGAARPHTP